MQPLEGSFNVFRGSEFIGTVYAVGDAWQYGALQEERCEGFEEAVERKVSLFDRLAAANVGDVVGSSTRYCTSNRRNWMMATQASEAPTPQWLGMARRGSAGLSFGLRVTRLNTWWSA